MEKKEILAKLNVVFGAVFNGRIIQLKDDLTATDVEGWDSLTHMILMNDIESKFDIKFRLRDLNKMKNVGDLIRLIQDKVE